MARAQILAGLCDVALVVGADTTPKGFFAPAGSGERSTGPRLAALPPARRHQPDLLRALRAPPHGALRRDRARLRAGEGEEQPRTALANPNARYRKIVHRRGGAGVADGLRPAAPARDLRHQRRRRGARAVEPRVRAQAQREAGHDRGGLDGHAALPADRDRDAELRDRLGRDACARARRLASRTRSRRRPTSRPASAPRTCTLAEVYDLSSALELDWYENIGLCKPGEAEKLLRDGVTPRSAAACR